MDYDLGKRRTPTSSPVIRRPISPRPQHVPSPQHMARSPVPTGGRSMPTKSAAVAPTKSAAVAPTKSAAAPTKYEPRVYTENEIQSLLDGYINVHPGMWDYVPTGAHVRYFRKGPAGRVERFRYGAYVKMHYANDDGKKFLLLENNPGGRGERYVKFPVAYEDIDQLWKKYDRGAFIEIHMISASLAQKKKQIEELTARQAKLESLVNALVDKLIKR